MSCDWDVRCVDCGEDACISEANHRDDLMRAIIKHAPALAGLAEMVAEAGQAGSHLYDLELHVSGHYVSLEFFAKHGRHSLRPVDEYGRFDAPCGVPVRCDRCRLDVACEEREHDSRFNHGHRVGNDWHRCVASPPSGTGGIPSPGASS